MLAIWAAAVITFISVGIAHFEQEEHGVVLADQMPNAWDRRYIKVDGRTGIEVAILGRSGARGRWVAHRPDGTMCQIVLADRRSVTTMRRTV